MSLPSQIRILSFSQGIQVIHSHRSISFSCKCNIIRTKQMQTQIGKTPRENTQSRQISNNALRFYSVLEQCGKLTIVDMFFWECGMSTFVAVVGVIRH